MLAALLVLKCLTVTMSMRGPHHPRGSNHYHQIPNADQKITQSKEVLQDVEHIKEDLKNILSSDQAFKMTPEELEFHYFKLHDFDNNTKLDGLEILQAIHHSTHYEEDKNNEKKEKTQINTVDNLTTMSEESTVNYDDFQYFVDLIDQVLAEDDTDNDGYLSYVEYVVGRQKESKSNPKPRYPKYS